LGLAWQVKVAMANLFLPACCLDLQPEETNFAALLQSHTRLFTILHIRALQEKFIKK
jgi:hypothetical protein